MAHISQSNWEVDYFIAPNTDLRLGLCDYNGTRVIFAASVPFIYVNYTAGFAFTDVLASQSGKVEIRQIMDGFDIKATYDLYGPDYLYEHIWRFYDDGQFGSTILIHGPGEEHDGQHTYHVPFRYDLDISGAAADSFQRWLSFGIVGFWASPPQEGQFIANPSIPPSIYDWQVLDNVTGKRAMARARDGDNGEIWALRYSPLEAWASWGGAQSSPPGSPGSVPAVYDNNQSIQNTDVVLWYTAHIPSLNLVTGGGPSFKLLGY